MVVGGGSGAKGRGKAGDWKESFRASRRDAAPAPTQPGGFEAIRTALHTERLQCQGADFFFFFFLLGRVRL